MSRAFSIVELIVVIVILVVVAGAVAPRISAITGRATRASAEHAAQVLSAAARRDSLTSQRIALDYDGTRLRMLVLDESYKDPWREDPLTPAADLSTVRVSEVLADTAPLDPTRWRVEFPQNTPRPALRLVLTDSRGRDPWRVELASRGGRAVVTPGDRAADAQAIEIDDAIDLDATGKSSEPW